MAPGNPSRPGGRAFLVAAPGMSPSDENVDVPTVTSSTSGFTPAMLLPGEISVIRGGLWFE